MPNCIRPPHFPPHCGCPAGAHADQPDILLVAETGGDSS